MLKPAYQDDNLLTLRQIIVLKAGLSIWKGCEAQLNWLEIADETERNRRCYNTSRTIFLTNFYFFKEMILNDEKKIL